MTNRESPCGMYMTDGYLYVADFRIVSYDIPTPGEQTQIKGNKKILHIHLSTSVILFSPFQFCFTINAVVFCSLLTSVLCCQPQRVGYRPLPSEGTVRIQAGI
jgi:hypothetical protein